MNKEKILEFLALENGVVVWRRSKSKAKAGSVFGSDNGSGYLQGGLFGKHLYAHRIAWLLHYGSLPAGEIDHINGNRSDNRIENLREIDRQGNSHNTHKVRSDSALGIQGVQAHRNKFRTRIKAGSVFIRSGGFDTAEEARAEYLRLKKQYHPAYKEVA